MLIIKRIDIFGFPILQLQGRLDLVTFPPLLSELAQMSPFGTVGLDLTDVQDLDAAGVALLESVSDWLQASGGRLRILGCSAEAERGLVRESSRGLSLVA